VLLEGSEPFMVDVVLPPRLLTQLQEAGQQLRVVVGTGDASQGHRAMISDELIAPGGGYISHHMSLQQVGGI
jgi:hypothetical protein